MSSRFDFPVSGNEGRIRAPMRRGAGKPLMSPKQIEAYLVARDALRRIQRASSKPLRSGPVGGTWAADRRTLES